MKNSLYLFIISFVLTACITVGFSGACAVYENTVRTAYGEDKKAVDIYKYGIRIFDFEYKIKG